MHPNPIGETILRILKSDDVSQSTFASRADIPDTTVSRWVNGTRPREDQWPKIFQGLRRTPFEFELELARVHCEYCSQEARKAGQPAPSFATSRWVRKIERVLALDLAQVDEANRAPMRRLRDLIVTIVAQCEPLLQELEDLYAGMVKIDEK